MQGLICQKYFIRKFGTPDFIETNLNETSEFNLIKTKYSDVKKEKVTSLENSVELYEQVPYRFKGVEPKKIHNIEPKIDWNTGKIFYDRKQAGSIKNNTISSFFKNNLCKEKRSEYFYNQNDQKGCSKDIFLLKETIDYSKFTFELTVFTINRNQLKYKEVESGVCKIPSVKSVFKFNFETGKVETKHKKGVKIAVDLPEQLMFDFLDLRNKWAGINLSVNSADTGINKLKALTVFPYEPNFNEIKEYFVHCGLNVPDRKNPSALKDFCTKNEIGNSSRLRKLYNKHPKNLLDFYNLKKCGFKDVNVIFEIISTSHFRDISRNYSDEIMFFMKYALKYRSEKAVWNLFCKFDSYYVLFNSLNYFLEFFDDLPKQLKKDLVYEGFTDYNFEVLNKKVEMLKKKTPEVAFKYSEDQLKLEGELDGYKFYLPENSEILEAIGDDMDNCVSSYKARIMSDISTIVCAEKGNKKQICIEVRADKVVQKLAPMNMPLKGEDDEVVHKWMAMHNLHSVD